MNIYANQRHNQSIAWPINDMTRLVSACRIDEASTAVVAVPDTADRVDSVPSTTQVATPRMLLTVEVLTMVLTAMWKASSLHLQGVPIRTCEHSVWCRVLCQRQCLESQGRRSRCHECPDKCALVKPCAASSCVELAAEACVGGVAIPE
jgi:hypothetical protein